MKTIGQIIKDARVEKSYSLSHVAGMTKIKTSFIDAIEKQKWGDLPSFPTVLGFVKSLAGALDLNERTAVAVLKREYPPKKLLVSPKPDVQRKFVWSPKLTFIIGVSAFLLIILGYLTLQYIRFISPPSLIVESPKEGQIVSGESVTVFGSTDADSKILVNNQPVLIDDNGNFSVSIGITSNTKEIDIVALNRSGKMTEVKRKIQEQ